MYIYTFICNYDWDAGSCHALPKELMLNAVALNAILDVDEFLGDGVSAPVFFRGEKQPSTDENRS